MKKNGFELTAGIVTLVLSVAALVLFFLSYTTGYSLTFTAVSVCGKTDA